MGEKEIQRVNRFNFKFVTIFFLLVVIVGIFILLRGKDNFDLQNQPRPKPGIQAPNFTFPDLKGERISLTDYKGKVVLLNIWATWCPPCVEEMPSMEKLYGEFKDEDFEILAVSIDTSGARIVAPFMKKHGLSFPILLDPDGAVTDLYGTIGIPESFILDKEGLIIKKVIGPVDWAAPGVINFLRDLAQRPNS